MADPKGARKPNWSRSEICFLIEAVSASQSLLLSKFRSADCNKRRQEAWRDVVRTVCAQSSSERLMDEVKKKWKDLVSQAKKDAHNKKYPGTGGGPQPQVSEWTDTIQNVVTIEQDCSASVVWGEPNNAQCSIPAVEAQHVQPPQNSIDSSDEEITNCSTPVSRSISRKRHPKQTFDDLVLVDIDRQKTEKEKFCLEIEILKAKKVKIEEDRQERAKRLEVLDVIKKAFLIKTEVLLMKKEMLKK